MTLLKTAIFFIFLLKTWANASTAVTKFEREWDIPLPLEGGLTSESNLLGKDNIAAYAKCNDTSKTKRDCILTYEFLHPEGFIFKNKCHLTFRHKENINKLTMMRMRAAKKGKVVISYIDEQEVMDMIWATAYTTYQVIDTTTCKFYEGKVFFNLTQLNHELGDKFWKGNVFLYDDGTMDTFLAQPNLCNGARCKVTFGIDGKIIDKPVSYLSSEMIAKDLTMAPFTEENSYKKFSIVMIDLPPIHSTESKSTSLKVLQAEANSKVSHTILDLNGVSLYDFDYSHGTLGICWGKNKTKTSTIIECQQFNIVGIVTFNATFELPYRVKTLKVKNTLGGEELLLLTDECENQQCENNGRYYIRAVKRRQPHSGNMEILNLDCDGFKKDIYISVFNEDSSDNSICVAASCERFMRSNEPGKFYNKMKLVRQCFKAKYIRQNL